MSRVLENKIRFTGDNQQLKRTIDQTDKVLKGSTQLTQRYVGALKDGLDKANLELSKLSKNLKSTQDIKALKTQAAHARELRKELEQIQKTGSVQGQMGGGGGGAGGGRGGGLKGKLGMLMGGAGLAMVMGGAMKSFGVRAQSAEVGMQLRGLGYGGFAENQRGGGMGKFKDPGAHLGLARQLAGAVGGPEGTRGVEATSYARGISPEQLISGAGVMRGAGAAAGSSVQAIQRVAGILGEAIGDGMNRGRIGDYLQVMTGSLEEMSSGVNINRESFASIFTELLQSDFFAANSKRAGAAMGGLNNFFKNSSGSTFGVAAGIMQEALTKDGKQPTGIETFAASKKGLLSQPREVQKRIFEILQGRLGQYKGAAAQGAHLSKLTGLEQGLSEEFSKVIMSGKLGQFLNKVKDTGETDEQKAQKNLNTIDGNIATMQGNIKLMYDSIGTELGTSVSWIAKAMGMDNKSITEKREQDEGTSIAKQRRMDVFKLGPGAVRRGGIGVGGIGNIGLGVDQGAFSGEGLSKIKTKATAALHAAEINTPLYQAILKLIIKVDKAIENPVQVNVSAEERRKGIKARIGKKK